MIKMISVNDPLKLTNELRVIYESTFPADERRDWKQFPDLLKNPRFDLSLIFHQQKLVGFITQWNLIKLHFVEHFAIRETDRGKGFGTQVIQQIICSKQTPVILEIEPPQSKAAIRRINFYERQNFKIFEGNYFQPPYSSGKNKIEMCLLSYPEQINWEDSEDIINLIYKEVYRFQV